MPELPQVIGFMSVPGPVFTKPAFITCIRLSVPGPVFTKPAFITCIRLVAGWMPCPARRAITGMDPFADPKRESRVDVYHSFFRAGAWMQS
ncbi:MAG: hypothetical protein LBE84_08225, partial [Planctomycetota bacterium]|nr:hypothetical protein [Planctomycetota bacterium]